MDTKRWSWFFIFLVSSGHIGGSYAKGGYTKTEVGCVITAELMDILDDCIEKAKLEVKGEKQVKDVVVKNVKASDCRCEGLDNMEITNCECVCYKDFIRIFIKVSLFDVLFSFVLSLGDNLLGGALSGLLDAVVDLLDEVVDLLVELLALRIDVIIVIDARFKDGKTVVRQISKPRLGDIELLGLEISGLSDILGGLIGDILSVVLDLLITTEFENAIIAAFEQVIIDKNYTTCPT